MGKKGAWHLFLTDTLSGGDNAGDAAQVFVTAYAAPLLPKHLQYTLSLSAAYLEDKVTARF
jgi:hypothetical protein